MSDAKVNGEAARQSLARALALVHTAARSAMQTGVSAAVASAKATTQFKDQSGDTRKSIRGTVTSERRGFVKAGGAAGFLEYGTRAHLIIAKGRALRFETGGQAVYRRFVRHPGTKPRPFMHEARDVGERAALAVIGELLSYALS